VGLVQTEGNLGAGDIFLSSPLMDLFVAIICIL